MYLGQDDVAAKSCNEIERRMKMAKHQIYIAGPYTHPYQEVRANREHQLTNAAATVAKHGHIVYSPITHSAPLTRRGLNLTHDEWMAFDKPFMELCDVLLVVTLDGWEQSKGVWHEIETFGMADKTIEYLLLDEIDKWARDLANGEPNEK
jgi:hypothetical protein